MLSDDIGQGMRTREMVKDILKSIREGVIPAKGVRKELWEALPPPERNPACSVAVKDWRKARTVTTLSWRDGLHAGTIGFITIAQDDMTPGQVDAFNQEFRGTCVVMRPFGHKEVANKKPGHYLDFNHPKMVALREYMNNKEITHEIHPGLVMNFDQVSIVCKVN